MDYVYCSEYYIHHRYCLYIMTQLSFVFQIEVKPRVCGQLGLCVYHIDMCICILHYTITLH